MLRIETCPWLEKDKALWNKETNVVYVRDGADAALLLLRLNELRTANLAEADTTFLRSLGIAP